MSKLTIPITFEEMNEALNTDTNKLMQIIQPVIDTENDINIILSNIKRSGNVVFFLGKSGVGKSTFLDSLKWRSHIIKRSVINVDSSSIVPEFGLNGLFVELQKIAKGAKTESDKGPTIIIIDYLESIEDQPEAQIKSFFRNLNGLVRQTTLLIIWPVTQLEDAKYMIDLANFIATTLFYPGKEIINFSGPREEEFINISKRTITVMNNGMEPSEFGITNDLFTEVFSSFKELASIHRTIRKFLQLLKNKWEKQSGYLQQVKDKIPKPIEVWFCFPYRNAESVISQFSRKGQTVDETWTPIHDKFYEYIHDNQRSAIWDATRLQLALYGYIKTRIMFLPTNALISAVYAYSDNSSIKDIIEKHDLPTHWQKQTIAKTFLKSTPIIKQAQGEKFQIGMRKGGPVARALSIAEPIYSELNTWMTKQDGSDKNINKPLAKAISEILEFDIQTEQKHPWLENIYPDILINLPDKTISIEMHYTDDDAPYKIADYVLKKLNIYMNQIEQKIH